MKKVAGCSTEGQEELAQVRRIVLTREDTKAQADVLFGNVAREMRKAERAKIDSLFVTAPLNQTMTPSLQKVSAALHVEAFFDKLASSHLTEAQQRYPELLKVAQQPTPSLKAKPIVAGKGPLPVRAGITGGSS